MPLALALQPTHENMPTPLTNPSLPTSFATQGAPAPQNSEIRKVAEDALDALKYSFASALASPTVRARPGSLEAEFQKQFARVPAEKLDRHRKYAKELVELPEPTRRFMFGRYAELSHEALLNAGFERVADMIKTPLVINDKLLGLKFPSLPILQGMRVQQVGDAVQVTGMRKPVNPKLSTEGFESPRRQLPAPDSAEIPVNADRLADIWGPLGEEGNLTDPEEFEGQDFLDKLSLNVERVKCVDETSPEWPGSDTIALGGISVDETGDVKKIPEQHIGGGFDDGDQKSYSPAKKYHSFDVTESMVKDQWPKRYGITILLAEKDHGGLSDALNSLWDKVKVEVKTKISAAVAKAVTPHLGPVISHAIGEATSWIVDVFAGWLIKVFKDDIFPPVNCSMTHAGPHARFAVNGKWGSPRSETYRANFYGHGGHYYVEYHWLLYK